MRQAAPLADGVHARHLHQLVDHVQLTVVAVTDAQVAAVHVHLPQQLLAAARLHLPRARMRQNKPATGDISTRFESCGDTPLCTLPRRVLWL